MKYTIDMDSMALDTPTTIQHPDTSPLRGGLPFSNKKKIQDFGMLRFALRWLENKLKHVSYQIGGETMMIYHMAESRKWKITWKAKKKQVVVLGCFGKRIP